MEKEFELFLREKQYVQNVSKNTLIFYKQSFVAFKKYLEVDSIDKLSKPELIKLVANMREQGLTPGNTDAYIRGINPFLSWLYENELTGEHFKIKRQKLEQRVIKTFTEIQIKAIINYKPKDYYEKRLHCVLLLLLDTGIRINEALTLTRSGIDFGNLLITVTGKGNKERIIPFSIELRKTLFRFSKLHNFDLIFSNRYGGKLLYDNLRREFNVLINKIGIEGFDGSFHAFRRCFASQFIKSGGSPFILMRLMGHTTLKQTNEYVKLVTEDLSAEHQRNSILNRLR
jgi:site-specific recombinase XerD